MLESNEFHKQFENSILVENCLLVALNLVGSYHMDFYLYLERGLGRDDLVRWC